MIGQLNSSKKYKLETYYIAVSIADRYLSKLATEKAVAPNLVCLATVAVLMAAKLEQPISPSFNKMILTRPTEKRCQVTK